MSQIRITIQLE